jgi:hypothetical protein
MEMRNAYIIPTAISPDASGAASVFASEASLLRRSSFGCEGWKQSMAKSLMLRLDRHGRQGGLAMTETVKTYGGWY